MNIILYLGRLKPCSQYYDAGPLAILEQVKLCCPQLSFLDWTQGCYVGYAGIEVGSIPASHCISTAFERMLEATQFITLCHIIVNQPYFHTTCFKPLYVSGGAEVVSSCKQQYDNKNGCRN